MVSPTPTTHPPTHTHKLARHKQAGAGVNTECEVFLACLRRDLNLPSDPCCGQQHRVLCVERCCCSQPRQALRVQKEGKRDESKVATASQGRDPYALFKQAIIASRPANENKKAAKLTRKEWTGNKRPTAEKMLEHQRENKHFQHMIRMRKAAVEALPEELRLEASQKDYEMLPIERRVFTETAPIPNFQAKLISTAQD